MVSPAEEAIHKDRVEVYARAVHLHMIPLLHAYDGEHPVFHEAVIRWGTVPADAEEAGDRAHPIFTSTAVAFYEP